MALTFSSAARAARAGAIITLAGAGAKLFLYTGTKPATADTAAAGDLLATLTCASVLGVSDANGVLTFNTIATGFSSTSGTPGYFRLTKADGVSNVLDGTVSASGGGGDMILVPNIISSSQTVRVTSLVLTELGAS